jgi:peptidoglycan/xylan/chitin deacetylase (PgdA/CDA1 family)
MTDKIPVAKFAVLLAAVVAVTGCSSAKQQSAAPSTAQATKPTPRPQARAKPRIVRPHNHAVPILMYHVVEPARAGVAFPGLYVRPSDFAGQMRWLAAHRYHAVTLSRVYDYWHYGLALPPKPIVISFDDGYRSTYSVAFPDLRRLHWPGVVNLEVAHTSTRWGLPPPLVRGLIRAGWEIDSHTLTHPDLTTVDAARLRSEIAGSRVAIRREFHVPVDFFCYPSGRYDGAVVAAVRAAGYLGATSTDYGLARPGDLFTLDRVRVSGSDGVAGLAAKLGAL